MSIPQIKRYDALVDEHTLKLLESLTLEIGDEETALHVTILSFEKLWNYMDINKEEPINTFDWLQVEAEKIIKP